MKTITLLILQLLIFCNMNAQIDVGQPYNEAEYGTITTERNFPPYFLKSKEDSTLVPCRIIAKKLLIFEDFNATKEININKPLNILTDDEKERIIINAWHNKDQASLNIVVKIATSRDPKDNLYLRKLSIMCLSQFKLDVSIQTLQAILSSNKPKESMISALSLVQLGITDRSFDYIKLHYHSYVPKNHIVSALMIINTPEAIKVLQEICNDKDPSYALDASAALSLLGHCDLAFKNIIKFKDSDKVFVRQMVAWCLAYYIGTPEAIKTIMDLKDDTDNLIGQDRENIFTIYKLKL